MSIMSSIVNACNGCKQHVFLMALMRFRLALHAAAFHYVVTVITVLMSSFMNSLNSHF